MSSQGREGEDGVRRCWDMEKSGIDVVEAYEGEPKGRYVVLKAL
jgi:hypothetical protein